MVKSSKESLVVTARIIVPETQHINDDVQRMKLDKRRIISLWLLYGWRNPEEVGFYTDKNECKSRGRI